MKKRSESERSGKAASAVKPEEAALLWRLLDPAVRARIGRFMSAAELKRLNESYQDYRRRDRAGRLMVERALVRDARSAWGSAPAFFFLGALCLLFGIFFAHRAVFPTSGFAFVLQLTGPLMIGIFSPLAFYMMPAYRARLLFRLPVRAKDFGMIVLSYVALAWVLSFIDMEDVTRKASLGMLNLMIVGLGAASAPLLEEIFFREVLPSFIGREPHYWGHLFSALMFAAAHLPTTPSMALLYVAAAVILAALRLETESLMAPFLAHAAANVTILVAGA